jgi:hypothetical protein
MMIQAIAIMIIQAIAIMIIQAIILICAYQPGLLRTKSSISSINACQADHQPVHDLSRHPTVPTHLCLRLQGPEGIEAVVVLDLVVIIPPFALEPLV